MSQNQSLEQGKLAYAKKRYDEVSRICTKILSDSKGLTEARLNALDLRCQAYAKLGKYDLARHDARNMIHLSKRKAPEGYIRCSQIERLVGDHTSAIKWLEHGSKNIPDHRTHFENQIRRIHELSRRKIANEKRQDPVAAVPLEVLQLVISYLDYREVVILLRVSRTWKNVLSVLQPLITTVDFTNARRKISYVACSAAFRRLCKQPHTLILPSLSQSAKNIVHSWLSKIIHLERLETLHLHDAEVPLTAMRLQKLFKIRSLRMDQSKEIDFDTLANVTATRHLLHDMCLSEITGTRSLVNKNMLHTSLQHLELRGRLFSPCSLPYTFFDRYPNLRTLRIQSIYIESGYLDLSQHQSLQRLYLTAVSESIELNLPSSLQELSCREWRGDRQSAVLSLREPINLPDLSTIILGGFWALTAIRAIQNSAEPPNPDNVGLYGIPRTICDSVPREGYSMLKNCRTLSFHSEELRTEDSSAFAALFPSIQSLILEAPQITGVFLSDLLKAQNRFKEIKLKGCNKISSDIRPWLISRGIECQVLSKYSESRDGQRIIDA